MKKYVVHKSARYECQFIEHQSFLSV